jgi:hypothetical protein
MWMVKENQIKSKKLLSTTPTPGLISNGITHLDKIILVFT